MSQSSGDKTEEPTPKRLRDARKKGQVGSSKEVVTASLITGIFVTLWVLSDYMVVRFRKLLLAPSDVVGDPFRIAVEVVFNVMFFTAVEIIVPLLLIVVVFAIFANFFQFGFLIAFESIQPKFEKLNPAQGLKKIFSMKNLFELFKSIIKITFLSILIYMVIEDSIYDLIKAPTCGVGCLLAVLGNIMKRIIIMTIISFVIIAAFDFFFQKHQHIKSLRMTKDEVKREYKEMEGDPHIKGKRKQLHREMLNSQDTSKVKQSSVLVTNPTHIAVALYYHRDYSPIPLVSVKGIGPVAEEMMAIARANNIPITQNIPLARGLYENVDVDHLVPPQFFKAVAEVINWLNQLKREQKERD